MAAKPSFFVTWDASTPTNTVAELDALEYACARVVMRKLGVISGGAIAFEVTVDGMDWFPVRAVPIGDLVPETSYTLTGASKLWQVGVAGSDTFRVRLTSPITGAGLVEVRGRSMQVNITPIVAVKSEGGGGGGVASWGSITGTLSSQTDLQTALDGKAASGHNHDASYEALGAAAAAVAAHAAAGDPHTGYQRESEKGAANGYASLDGAGTVPDAQIPSAIARDAEVTSAISTHAGAADPHTGYQLESQKGAANGYASLDANTRVPLAELGSGSPSASNFLRGDGSWATPAGGGGGSGQLVVPLVADGANVAWTNMPSAVTFFGGSHRYATKVDLSSYTQVRLIVNKQGTAGAAASIVRLRYRTAFDTTVGNWLQIGTSSVQVAVNVQNTVLDSGWVDLAAGAIADVFLALDGSGGDGVLDPAFGSIAAQFK